MSNLRAINEIVSKWKLNQTLLAKKIGMPKSSFVACVNGAKYYKFTDKQKKKLGILIKEMIGDLGSLL